MLGHVGLDRLGDVVLDASEGIDLVVHRIDPGIGEVIAAGDLGRAFAALLLRLGQEGAARFLQLTLQHLVGVPGQLWSCAAAHENEPRHTEQACGDDQLSAKRMGAHLSQAHAPCGWRAIRTRRDLCLARHAGQHVAQLQVVGLHQLVSLAQCDFGLVGVGGLRLRHLHALLDSFENAILVHGHTAARSRGMASYWSVLAMRL
ncbi:hypothetical protein D3C84_791690 [compost metagenome]